MDKDFGTTDEIELETWLEHELRYTAQPPEMDEHDPDQD